MCSSEIIQANYRAVRQKIDEAAGRCGRRAGDIQLVAVSKNQPAESIRTLFEAGQTAFGENRVQELLQKQSVLSEPISWHFIGPLQRNKVRKIVGQCALIHSVDSFEVALKVSEVSVEMACISKLLLEVNTSGEITKHGLSIDEWRKHFDKLSKLPALSIAGLMTLAPPTSSESIVRGCFSALRHFRDELELEHLSMGMSQDYPWAIAEGATIVRIGSALFADSLHKYFQLFFKKSAPLQEIGPILLSNFS